MNPMTASTRPQILEAGTYAGLGACGNEDWFQVDVGPNEILDVRLEGVDAGGTPRLDILDAAGTVLSSGAGLTGGLQTFMMPEAEARILLIRVASDGARFQYDLVIELAESPEVSDLRVSGGQVSHALFSKDRTWPFSFRSLIRAVWRLLRARLGFSRD